MNTKTNRKKIFISKQLFYLIFFFLFSFIIIFYLHNNIHKLNNLFIYSVKQFSSKYDYNLNSYEINALNYIDKNDIIKIIKPYLNNSIFL